MKQETLKLIDPNYDTNNFKKDYKSNTLGKSILLIDEVDVFFSESFYGKTYNAGVNFKHPLISEIIKSIW